VSQNVIRPTFRRTVTQTLLDDLRKVINDNKNDEVYVSEIVAVLEMLKYEYLERNTP
jgi:bifunctional N-acetylglucosamine-1-phosphate-uridyltransferase/glucosamine-1-phosphate-acetyltransferase GlmU-like protein